MEQKKSAVLKSNFGNADLIFYKFNSFFNL